MNITTLSGPALQREDAKRHVAHLMLLDEMIAAGRGHERPSETRGKADALSVRFNATLAACSEVAGERQRRMAYHGSLRPVRVA